MINNKYYEDRIVAFIDLQGFSKKITEAGNNEGKLENIYRILNAMKTMENRTLKENVFKQLDNISPDEKKLLTKGYQCIAISDSMVISYPATPFAFYVLTQELAMMQWALLWKWKYLVRGYITRGGCYFKDGVLFGEAYNRAYEGAEKNSSHVLPYILIQEYLVTNPTNLAETSDLLFKKDHLDRYFINYASFIESSPVDKSGADNKQQVLQAMKFIQENLEDEKQKPQIIEKYYWTYKYLCSQNSYANEIKNKELIRP